MTTMALIRSRRRRYHGRIVQPCNARRVEGWIIFIEGGRYIFNVIPIIWARWPTHGGIIIISGRALIVVVVVLLFGGGIAVVVNAI